MERGSVQHQLMITPYSLLVWITRLQSNAMYTVIKNKLSFKPYFLPILRFSLFQEDYTHHP